MLSDSTVTASHHAQTRTTRTKLVLATFLMSIWGSLPSTACVCADGTIKIICPGAGSDERCCCSTTPQSCAGCAVRCDTCRTKFATFVRHESVSGRQLSKPCGCHQVAKDQATLLSGVSFEEDDSQTSVLGASSDRTISRATWFRLASVNENSERPPDDIIILFRHLII